MIGTNPAPYFTIQALQPLLVLANKPELVSRQAEECEERVEFFPRMATLMARREGAGVAAQSAIIRGVWVAAFSERATKPVVLID